MVALIIIMKIVLICSNNNNNNDYGDGTSRPVHGSFFGKSRPGTSRNHGFDRPFSLAVDFP